MSLNTLGFVISTIVMLALLICTPRLAGTARAAALVMMLLAVVACLFFLTGIHTGTAAL